MWSPEQTHAITRRAIDGLAAAANGLNQHPSRASNNGQVAGTSAMPGIVIGSVAGAVFLVGLGVFSYRRWQDRKAAQTVEDDLEAKRKSHARADLAEARVAKVFRPIAVDVSPRSATASPAPPIPQTRVGASVDPSVLAPARAVAPPSRQQQLVGAPVSRSVHTSAYGHDADDDDDDDESQTPRLEHDSFGAVDRPVRIRMLT